MEARLMTSYYVTQMRAFEEIDKMLLQTIESGNSINIALFTLDFSKRYPVSPRTIIKRIELFVQANKDNVEIKNNEVRLI